MENGSDWVRPLLDDMEQRLRRQPPRLRGGPGRGVQAQHLRAPLPRGGPHGPGRAARRRQRAVRLGLPAPRGHGRPAQLRRRARGPARRRGGQGHGRQPRPPHERGLRRYPVDAAPQLPGLHAHQRRADPAVRRRVRGPHASRCWATSASPTPTPRRGRPGWPRGCWPRAWARAAGSGCSPPTGPTGSSAGWRPRASGRWCRCSTPTPRPASSAGCIRHADVGTAAHRGPLPRPRLPRPARGGRARPGRAPPPSTSACESHPYLRSGVDARGDGTRPWAGPIADLAARGDAVSDELLARRRGRGDPGRPDGGRVLVGQHRGPQGRDPQPRRRASATPTTCGSCATSTPTTCSTRRCRCSGWAG